jgi:hypothetical protein
LLDNVEHRHLKLARLNDHSVASGMHASFVAAAEFALAAREFAILFVRGGGENPAQIEPIVLLGVTPGENLFVDGTRWDARYVPAYVRRYPFMPARVEGREDTAVMIDRSWAGFSDTEGDPLYEGEGKASARLTEAVEFMKQFEVEAVRTLSFCRRVSELDLLREMSAKVTLAGGKTLALDGLLAIDETKLLALPDAQVIELHRNGMLGLMHAHLLSLSNMQTLVERKAQRLARAAAH